MEGKDSNLLDDEVYPFEPPDGLPDSHRQPQVVDQGIHVELFRTEYDPGVDNFYVRQTIAGQEHLLDMDSSGGFRAGQWASTDEQKIFLRLVLEAEPWLWIGSIMVTGFPTFWLLQHLSARNI